MVLKKIKTSRPSAHIVAPIPAKLTYYDSRQRIKKNEDNAALRLFMPIQPFDDRYRETKGIAYRMDIEREANNRINSRREIFESPYAWKRHFQGFNARLAQEIRFEMSIEEIISRRRLNVADFSPMDSPYVPGVILHFLLMYPTSSNERALLAKIYGPLLISFSERPVAINKTITFASEEAALLETILEVCNASFWNHLGMLKINSAFDNMKRIVAKLPNVKYSLSIVRKIYQEEFEISDFVSERYLLPPKKHHELKGKLESRVVRQPFILDNAEENVCKVEESGMGTRPRGSTKPETSKSRAKVLPEPNKVRSILIRSNDAIFRDVQKMRLQDTVQPPKNLLKPMLAAPDLTLLL
ncbi:unnamed protein product [Taenia asiatica]|uniref:SPK domain-containing protein n=1 Tax=Taenia asiatica TaxID=60517 RepID=A0A0R3W5K6_TAEAS|nr:unnamed protein product [Taenia asiatica]